MINGLEHINYYCVLALAIAAAVSDTLRGTIPNYLTYTSIILAFGLALSSFEPRFLSALMGMLTAALPLLLLFYLGSIGGGDVKLLVGVGGFLGFPIIVDVLFWSIVVGSLMAIVAVIYSGRFIELIKGLFLLCRSLAYPGMEKIVPFTRLHIPMAVAVAIAVLGVVFFPKWLVFTTGFYGWPV